MCFCTLGLHANTRRRIQVVGSFLQRASRKMDFSGKTKTVANVLEKVRLLKDRHDIISKTYYQDVIKINSCDSFVIIRLVRQIKQLRIKRGPLDRGL